MCGITGYVGPRAAIDVILPGLARLEYRGYDSAGIAVVGEDGIVARKRAGRLSNLVSTLADDPLPQSTTGIGHTRWATHGAPSDVNAHPHISADGRVAVIHNGIIENHLELRADLAARGIAHVSETDSETVAHLIADLLEESDDDLSEAMRRACGQLRGAFTIVAIDHANPGTIVAARRNSPLVVGLGDGETFVASDVSAFAEHTRSALEIGQDEVVVLTEAGAHVTDMKGRPVSSRAFEVDWSTDAVDKDGHDLFMLKEIAEQPTAVANALLGRIDPTGRVVLDELAPLADRLRPMDRLLLIGCGTAAHAGMVAQYALEEWLNIPVEVHLASEFRYRSTPIGPRTAVVAISQSGETMDTLMAMRHAQAAGALVIAVCNSVGSTMAREADGAVHTCAGPEVSVASTKAFLTQLVTIFAMGLHLARERSSRTTPDLTRAARALQSLPEAVAQTVAGADHVRAIARELASASSVLFIGRHTGYPVALEGALKLKELAYMHAEGFAAGELKHGPIALIDSGVPVIVIVPPATEPVLREKVLSNAQETRARGARVIAVTSDLTDAVRRIAHDIIEIPVVPGLFQPVVATIPLQVLACEVATAKGFDVDQPRNLAKSVTVE